MSRLAMQLTRYSDYSLRVLMHLAVTERRLSTIEEIAAAYAISRGHLMKVVQNLGALGFVETVRGRGGGIRLALPPEEIVVGDVIRRTEGLGIVECLRPDGGCPIVPVCALRRALVDAVDAFLRVLDGYTVADLVAHRRPRLARLLGIAGAPRR